MWAPAGAVGGGTPAGSGAAPQSGAPATGATGNGPADGGSVPGSSTPVDIPPVDTPPVDTPPVDTPPGGTPDGPALPPILDALAVLTPFPAGTRVFATTSIWNEPLAEDAPLDPSSDRLSAALAAEVRHEVDASTGPWINTTKFSVPVYTVGANVPGVHVTLDTVKPALQRDFDSVPIPAGAKQSADSDALLVIYQPATDTVWELFHARQDIDGWHARWGGKMTNASTSPGYFPYPYGASASGLALLGGLMTVAELKAGAIDHALAIAVPNTAIGKRTWPALRNDGRSIDPDAIPEGTRFRIDPAVDLSKLGLTGAGLAIARAAQRYGILVRDGASNVAFYGEDPSTTSSNPYGQIFGGRYPNAVLRDFPWDRLQVVAPPSR
jgi:hypothetical protein